MNGFMIFMYYIYLKYEYVIYYMVKNGDKGKEWRNRKYRLTNIINNIFDKINVIHQIMPYYYDDSGVFVQTITPVLSIKRTLKTTLDNRINNHKLSPNP